MPASTVDETAQKQASLLPLLLISFPLVIAFARTPGVIAIVFTAFLVVAHKYACLKPFLITLGVALLLSLLVFTGAVIHFDIDAYLAPQIRLLTLPSTLTTDGDGYYRVLHCRLPQGLAAYGAALYRLTGSVDLATSAFFLFLVATWSTLRQTLSRLQTFLLVAAPVALPSLFCLMQDGCIYYLLLIALFSLRQRNFWLPLTAIVIASTYKTSAWIPAVLIAGVLLYQHPRRWWQIACGGTLALLVNFSTLHLILTGGLNTISNDFHSWANNDTRAMGHFARLAYIHLGHWTTSLQPVIGTHIGGVDGLSSDGLGPIMRLVTWLSFLCMIFYRKQFRGWWGTFALMWISILTIPTLYIGYARYVPFLYVAGFLPLILRFPRLSLLPYAGLILLPLAMLGWRFVLSTETLFVANHATAVHSTVYNIRATFRPLLTNTPQPLQSGSLLYSYQMPDEKLFPAMPRQYYAGIERVSTLNKASEIKTYILHDWLPWMLRSPHRYLIEIARFRWRAFTTFPRGVHDGLPSATTP